MKFHPLEVELTLLVELLLFIGPFRVKKKRQFLAGENLEIREWGARVKLEKKRFQLLDFLGQFFFIFLGS